MKVKEWETYRAVYCGLCKQLSADYGFLARMSLSYDFTFLALLAAGVMPQSVCYEKKRCPVHPVKRRYCYCGAEDLRLAAAAEVLLVEAKLRDNCADAGFWKKLAARMLLPLMRRKRKKAAAAYPALAEATDRYLCEQQALEQAHCAKVDQAAEPTAQVLSVYFSSLSDDHHQRQVLSRVGYLTGRYVYLMDALDDLEEDYQSGDYNVYLAALPAGESPDFAAIRQYAKEVQSLTIGQLAEAFELLTMRRFRTILQNIIYLGFHQSVADVQKRTMEKPRRVEEL